MKSWLKISFAFVFVLSLAFTAVPSNVQAFHDTSSEGVASGSWHSSGVASSEIPMQLVTPPGPAWLQLLANGLDLSAPARICHPFRGGQFGWTAEIRMLDGDSWVKLPTTVDWTPTSEGTLIACATASKAGTYALFGYFTQPAPKPVDCEALFDEVEIIGIINSGLLSLGGTVNPALFPHVQVVMTFSDVSPEGAIDPLHYSTHTDAFGYFTLGPVAVGSSSYNVDVSIAGCQLRLG